MSCRGRFSILIVSMTLIGAVAGCATPRIQPVDPQIFLNSELAFLKDGITTREEVCLKLGIPTAQLEGDRILMFQFRAEEDGKWQLVSPKFCGSLRAWDRNTMSLVLVFDKGGVLQKHSMVMSK